MNRRHFLGTALACGAALRVPAARPRGSVADGFSMTVLNPDCMVGGAGQCVVIRSPSGKTYLYDTGNGDFRGEKTKNNGRDIVAPWLTAHGIGRIDALVISHYHADHFGGFLWLADHFPIARLFDNGYTPPFDGLTPHDLREYEVSRAAIDAWGRAHPGCLVRPTKAGDDLGWNEPDFKVDVVWPPREGPVKPIGNRVGYTKGDNPFHHLLNGNSTGLRVTTGGKTFFIAGDIQADYVATYMRPYLKARGQWGADFVVLPAHGTKADETRELMADMEPRPRAAVASLGNLAWMIDIGREAVRVFAKAGVAAYATNLNGDITVFVRNGRLVVESEIERLYAHDPK